MSEALNVEVLKALLDGQALPPYDHRWLERNKISMNSMQVCEWRQTAEEAVRLFEEIGIKYVLIKALDIPYYFQVDIDFLIESPWDILDSVDILQREGYRIYAASRMFCVRPLKLVAVKPRSKVSIDIYPLPAWVKLCVADPGYITYHRKRRKINEIEAYFPTPEEDLYLIGTHAYNNRRFTLGECAHGIKTIMKYDINWKRIFEVAEKWKLSHALTLYISLAQLLSEIMNDQLKTRIPYPNSYLCRRALKFISKQKPLVFPLNMPDSLWVTSSILRISLIRQSLENFYGEPLTMLLNIAAEKLKGLTES